jgi:hypothetical protein
MSRGLHRLPLEKPIYEIEDRIAALEAAPLGGQQQEELRRLKREVVEVQKNDLRQPRSLADGRGGPPSRPARRRATILAGVRRVRRTPRRQVVRRRSGDADRLRQTRWSQGARDRPPKRKDAGRAAGLPLRLRPPRGLPQGDGQDAAGGQVRSAGDLPDRHARGLSRRRCRGTRPGPGDRREHVPDGDAPGAGRLRGDRRGGSGGPSGSESATVWRCSSMRITA